jgi:hypothetical protein
MFFEVSLLIVLAAVLTFSAAFEFFIEFALTARFS